MSKPWWQNRALRIYHPHAREADLRDLDVPRFVGDCLATHAEAIVMDAGGLYALYPSQVAYHRSRPALGARDLLGEIVGEARRQGLRVIAGADFSLAREEVWRAHPEWFQRGADGQVAREGDTYVTCPLGGYRNEGFAYPVLREILTRYDVDGVHLNASGFAGFCTCDACAASFGAPLPRDRESDPEAWYRYLCWRARVVAEQMTRYHELLRAIAPDVFFTADLAGPQNPQWAHAAGQHLPSLARSFSQLSLTSGGVGAARRSRWWGSLAAEQARAARRSKRDPLIHIEMHLRDLDLPYALMPPAEFALDGYQALAQGAGLTVSTFGIPARQLDPRTLPALTQVFDFMRQQQEVLDTVEPIAHVALVWPEWAILRSSALEGGATEGLRGEFLGLYHALKAQHVLFSLLYDEHISPLRLKRCQAVVLPTAVWLNAEQAEALAEYVRRGGHLILLDSPAASPSGGFLPMPPALVALIGGTWGEQAGEARYALPTAQPVPHPAREVARLAQGFRPLPRALSDVLSDPWGRETKQGGIGPLPLGRPYRRIAPPEGAQVWLRSARATESSAPEDVGDLEPGEDALLMAVGVGEGLVVYAATGLGQMALDRGHPDYVTLLGAMVSHGALTQPYLLTDAPSCVSVNLSHWRLGVVIHLLNAAGPAPLDAPVSVGPIQLDLAWDGPGVAQLCASGATPQDLPCQECWNRIVVTVPRLGTYAQVVVRSG